MAKPKNLNDKSSEYIEENFLSATPQGLDNREDVMSEGRIVVSAVIPDMRTIQFINGRDPGQELMFHYHSKTHPLKQYTLFHGIEYTLPVEVIEQLENCNLKQYAYRKNIESGLPEPYVTGCKYLYQCRTAKQRAA